MITGTLTFAESEAKRISDWLTAKIKHTRQKKGLSQKALAKIIGISQARLSCIEKGRAIITLPVLFTLAEALQLRVTLKLE